MTWKFFNNNMVKQCRVSSFRPVCKVGHCTMSMSRTHTFFSAERGERRHLWRPPAGLFAFFFRYMLRRRQHNENTTNKLRDEIRDRWSIPGRKNWCDNLPDWLRWSVDSDEPSSSTGTHSTHTHIGEGKFSTLDEPFRVWGKTKLCFTSRTISPLRQAWLEKNHSRNVGGTLRYFLGSSHSTRTHNTVRTPPRTLGQQYQSRAMKRCTAGC